MAGEKYVAPAKAPAELLRLNYEQMREIAFRPEHALWRNESLFNVQFFHQGALYDRRVQVHAVKAGIPVPIEFHSEFFDYGKIKLKTPLPSSVGFAGFRLHYPLNEPNYLDEVAAHLGASYFRILGREQFYGLSARGLAVDTALPKGEEFPIFSEFWLEVPAAEAHEIVYYALLDSPSVTGAYRFVLRPGTQTIMEVTAQLFARQNVEKLGIAPLTSMMLYGENRAGVGFDDVRPEVHDSDSLLVQTQSGEWVLRPLINPRVLEVSAFIGDSPRGFGLLQRDRDPNHYEDLESRVQHRPSYWVEPLEPWGKGQVELVEIPSKKETDDNIVAYWVSEKPLKKGDEAKLSYRIYALLDDPKLSPAGRVVSTRVGSAGTPGMHGTLPRDARRFVVEFEGGELSLIRRAQPVEPVIEASTGKVMQSNVVRNGDNGRWRLQFNFVPEPGRPSDIRCFLRLAGHNLSETWTYRWTME